LLFPTHYLGNFILGLPWVRQVVEENPDALVVLDSRFLPLAATVLPQSAQLLAYPRHKLASSQPFFSRLQHYWRFLRQLRRRPAATLVDMEGERFTGVLSWLSGCRRRIGPSGKHAERFYTDVLDLDYRRHRFNAFAEVLEDLLAGQRPDSHLQFGLDQAVQQAVASRLPPSGGHRIAIHPGASVSYKLWPEDYFVSLVSELEALGYEVVWVGAGSLDQGIIDRVMARLPNSRASSLCNELDFVELVALYQQCACFIGSDSGPMHLAAATGIPVLALFGPSVEAIWSPLGDNSRVLRGSKACGENCDAWQCDFGYHCLTSLTPEMVVSAARQHARPQALEATAT
jgi:heptosyltransferase-3